MPAHNGVRRPTKQLTPTLNRTVNKHKLLVITRSRVTEKDVPKPTHTNRHRPGQPIKQRDVVTPKLTPSPTGDRLTHSLPTSSGDQLPLTVAPNPNHPLPKRKEKIKSPHGLRPSRDVPGKHNQVSRTNIRLTQHSRERGQNPMHIRKNSNAVDHGTCIHRPSIAAHPPTRHPVHHKHTTAPDLNPPDPIPSSPTSDPLRPRPPTPRTLRPIPLRPISLNTSTLPSTVPRNPSP